MKSKKSIALLLVFTLLLTTGTISPFDLNGNGTKAVKAAEESDEFYNEGGYQAGSEKIPYQIGTAAQLRHMYDLVMSGAKNKDGVLYSECYYKLIQDVTIIDGSVTISADGKSAVFLDPDGKSLTETDLADMKWNPILNFNGHFDGDGKMISGLYIAEEALSGGTGLFDQLGEDAVIQNVKMKNSIIVKKDWFISSEKISLIAGLSTEGSVENCSTDADSCHIGRLVTELPSMQTPTPETTHSPTPTAMVTEFPVMTSTPTAMVTEFPVMTSTPTAAVTGSPAPVLDTPAPTPAATADTVIEKGKKIKVGGVTYKGVGKNEVAYSGTANVKKGAVTVPASVKVNGVSCKVTTIGEGAFAGNKKIKRVTLGKNVKTIGKGAFKNCTSLTSVTFPAKIKTVSAQAFYNCKKLKQAKLPVTVSKIGRETFKNCVSMKKFSVGAKTSKKTLYAAPATTSAKKISIGAGAMENCIKLKQIVINAQVRRIGNAAFRQCKNLADIFVYSLKLQYVGKRALKGVSNCKISVPKKKISPYTKLFRNKGQGKKVVVAKL